MERGNPEVLRGEQNGTAVLSEAQVIEVRELVDKGHSKVLVAEQFGVTDVLIGMIARGEAWTHVGGPLTVTKRCKSSRFRGVTKHAGGKWEAEIRINRQRMYLGLFTTEEEAALAFNRAILLNRLDRPLSIYQYQPMENRA